MESYVKLLRLAEVCKRTTLAKSTLWLKISKNQFIKPAKIGGINCWKESDVNEWINSHFPSNPINHEGDK